MCVQVAFAALMLSQITVLNQFGFLVRIRVRLRGRVVIRVVFVSRFTTDGLFNWGQSSSILYPHRRDDLWLIDNRVFFLGNCNYGVVTHIPFPHTTINTVSLCQRCGHLHGARCAGAGADASNRGEKLVSRNSTNITPRHTISQQAFHTKTPRYIFINSSY